MNTQKTDYVIKALGKALKKAREDKKMTRETTAEIVGVAPRHIQAIENEGQYPSIQLLFRLVTMFKISIDQYLYFDEPKSQTTLRRQVNMILDDFNDTELLIIEGTAKGICRAKEEHAQNT